MKSLFHWFYNQKINTSIFLTLFTILLLSIAFSGYLLFNFQHHTYESYLKKDHDKILSLLSKSLEVPLWNYSQTMGKDIIDAISKDERIVEITVWDIDKREVFLHAFFPDRLQDTIYTQTTPIMSENKRFGELTVKLSSHVMEQELQKIFQTNILFFFLQFSLSLFLLILLFYLKITRPIQKLLHYISHIGDHQINPKTIWLHDDEISTIGKAFEKAKETITNMAIMDSLTGIYNHYMLRKLLNQTFRYTHKNGHSSTIILIDINNFNQINDYYGHHKGDVVLKELSSMLLEHKGENDFVGRWSGKEFMMICPNQTPLEVEPSIIAIQEHIEKSLFDTSITLSCSFGLTGLDEKDRDIEQVLRRAHKALHTAKGTPNQSIIIH